MSHRLTDLFGKSFQPASPRGDQDAGDIGGGDGQTGLEWLDEGVSPSELSRQDRSDRPRGLADAERAIGRAQARRLRKGAGLEPDTLLLDEPDSGLDPVRTALLGELILKIHRDTMDEAKQKNICRRSA